MRTTRIAVVVSLLAVGTSGCHVLERMGMGTRHVYGSTTLCAGATCQVPVSVSADCVITAGDVDLKNNTTPMVNIAWHLTGGTFAPNGIFIKSGPAGHFSGGHGGGPVFTHQFRNSPKNLRWEFGVRVVGANGRTCVFDPYVMN